MVEINGYHSLINTTSQCRLKITYILSKGQRELNNSQPDPTGTTYIGDGSWGPIVHSCKPHNTAVMEKAGLLHHVWVIEIDETNEVKGKAYGLDREVLDEFVHVAN